MKKKHIIPFKWLPASWGLAGPARLEAEAYYNYEGYLLEERLAEIHLSGDDLVKRKAEIQHAHGIITDHEREIVIAKLEADETTRMINLLDAAIRHGSMDPIEGDKQIATLKGEPWIRVINDGLSADKSIDGFFFEFDWNDLWIEQLKDAGYMGATEEAIVESWFQEICRIEASASMGAPPINGGIVRG